MDYRGYKALRGQFYAQDQHRLELIYKYKNRQNFLDAEIEINEKGVATPLVGAVQSHSIRYNKTDKNLFPKSV